ncbi:MAG: Fe-S protein assembly co-chaperone HscB [Burkholderiaceae bacterium]
MVLKTRNYFELFSLPAAFRLDERALERAFRDVQSTVHPDRFAAAPEQQRRLAMQMATLVNEAYRVLRDPARRAEYLCATNGVSLQAESNTAMPADFLIEQMQWREQLDEAKAARDQAALDGLRAGLQRQRAQLIDELAAALDDRRDFDEAADLVRRLMFIDRFGSDVDLAEDLM